MAFSGSQKTALSSMALPGRTRSFSAKSQLVITPAVTFTLKSRSLAATLKDRDLAFTLKRRW